MFIGLISAVKKADNKSVFFFCSHYQHLKSSYYSANRLSEASIRETYNFRNTWPIIFSMAKLFIKLNFTNLTSSKLILHFRKFFLHTPYWLSPVKSIWNISWALALDETCMFTNWIWPEIENAQLLKSVPQHLQKMIRHKLKRKIVKQFRNLDKTNLLFYVFKNAWGHA